MWQLYKRPTTVAHTNIGTVSSDPSLDMDASVPNPEPANVENMVSS
jgi:hypothetical protein